MTRPHATTLSKRRKTPEASSTTVLVDAAAMLRKGGEMAAASKARSERDAVADIAQMLERRARILDEIREALEELQAEVAGRDRRSCCSKGCSKCTKG